MNAEVRIAIGVTMLVGGIFLSPPLQRALEISGTVFMVIGAGVILRALRTLQK